MKKETQCGNKLNEDELINSLIHEVINPDLAFPNTYIHGTYPVNLESIAKRGLLCSNDARDYAKRRGYGGGYFPKQICFSGPSSISIDIELLVCGKSKKGWTKEHFDTFLVVWHPDIYDARHKENVICDNSEAHYDGNLDFNNEKDALKGIVLNNLYKAPNLEESMKFAKEMKIPLLKRNGGSGYFRRWAMEYNPLQKISEYLSLDEEDSSKLDSKELVERGISSTPNPHEFRRKLFKRLQDHPRIGRYYDAKEWFEFLLKSKIGDEKWSKYSRGMGEIK